MLNFIKRILNIGGPQIEIATQDSIYYPSDLIRGELLITAPAYRHNIQSITIDLKDFWVDSAARGRTRVNRYHEHGSITVANDYEFLPRMKYQFSFEIQLPVNCRVSSEDSGWRLGVVINPSESSAIRKDFTINVQLSKTLQTLIEAIEKETNFIEVPRGRKYIPDISATRLIFRPPEHLQPELQYMNIDISLTGEGGIEGNILFNKSKDSSLSQFISNSGENHLHEFHIKPAQLFDSNNQVNSRTLTNIVSEKSMELLSHK